MKLTLLRHGITEGNRRRLYYGSTDLPLLPGRVGGAGGLTCPRRLPYGNAVLYQWHDPDGADPAGSLRPGFP